MKKEDVRRAIEIVKETKAKEKAQEFSKKFARKAKRYLKHKLVIDVNACIEKGGQMKEFYKKHGFDIERSLERNRKFHIVRYYPKIQTYEFINVGIILYDRDEVYYRLLQHEEVSRLHCPSLIESKVLKNSLESLDKFLQDQKSQKEVLRDISKRYKNILDTSFQLVYAGNEASEDLTKKLFYDYIGYKFDVEEKKDRLHQLIEATKSLVSKEFKNLEVKKSKIKGYNLDFFNKQTQQIHHSLLGSIENSENVARAFRTAMFP